MKQTTKLVCLNCGYECGTERVIRLESSEAWGRTVQEEVRVNLSDCCLDTAMKVEDEDDL